MQGLAAVKIAIAQLAADAHTELCLQRITALVERAAAQGARMVFFPEYAMASADRGADWVKSVAQPPDGRFVSALQALATRYNIWISAGMYEQAEPLPYNTTVLLDAKGVLRTFHRKTRLFDSGGFGESLCCLAGQQLSAPVPTPIGRLALRTCYELRFPALFECLQDRADVVALSAGWVAGAHKVLQWKTLLAARAIETRAFVLGIDLWQQGRFVGCSAAYAPTGELLGSLSEGQDILLLDLPAAL